MIRSVLIAGGTKEDSNVSKFLSSHFLSYSHVLYSPGNGRLLPEHDAAIMVVTASSHELSAFVREQYKGKPQYVITHGISNIKDQFLTDVYGYGVYKRLTDLSSMLDDHGNPMRGGQPGDYFHLKARVMWIIARFNEKGTAILRSDYGPRLDKFFGFSDKGGITLGSIANVSPDCLESTSKRGEYIFHGIPASYRDVYRKFDIPYKNEWFIDWNSKSPVMPHVVIIKRPVHDANQHLEMQLEEASRRLIEDVAQSNSEAVAAPAIFHPPTTTTTTTTTTTEDTSDMTAQFELLLESMAKQQEQIADLARMEERVREVIQHEIRGVTKLVSDIIPQLQGLTPDQLDKVTQMIGLMLSMNQPLKRA
jgi:hypothetical protein